MKGVWEWIRRYWYVPLTVVGALLGILAGTQFQRRLSVADAKRRVTREIKAIDKASAVAVVVNAHGKERALKALTQTHALEMEGLDDRQRAKAERLRKDPAALAKYLVRLGDGEG